MSPVLRPDGSYIDRFDEFVDTYVVPTMTRAGFRHRGRNFVLEGSDRALVIVQVSKFGSTGFHVNWSAVPPALRAFREHQKPRARPTLSWGFFYARVMVPPEFNQSSHLSSLWDYEETPLGFDEFGAAFQGYLEAQVIPRWRKALTREYLLSAAQQDPDVMRAGSGSSDIGGPYWTPLFLLVDDGDPDFVRSLLDEVSRWPARDDGLVDWLKARFAGRQRGDR